MRVVLFTGKGGVGKTSLALATALRAAERGQRVFVLSADPAHSLSDALGQRVGPRPVRVAPRLHAQEPSVLEEIDRAWTEIASWLRGLLRDEVDPVLADELLVVPGLEELIALRAIREVEATGEHDLCLVDCAPTGATLRLLRFPEALRLLMDGVFDLERRGARWLRPLAGAVRAGHLVPGEAVFDAFERLWRDVDDVRRILLDGRRTSARLVLSPARVVLDETLRTYSYLCLHGIPTDAVIVNRTLPALASNGFFARWAERERAVREEIERSFPMPVLCAPLLAREPVGLDALAALGAQVWGDRDPAALLGDARPLRWRRRGERVVLSVALPCASKDEIDVSARGDELWLRVRDASRRIALPASARGREIESARLARGVLDVTFAP